MVPVLYSFHMSTTAFSIIDDQYISLFQINWFKQPIMFYEPEKSMQRTAMVKAQKKGDMWNVSTSNASMGEQI